jgi:hypothetical protein
LIENGKWRLLPRGKNAIYGHTSNMMDNRMIVFGGLTVQKNTYFALNQIVEYNIGNPFNELKI